MKLSHTLASVAILTVGGQAFAEGQQIKGDHYTIDVAAAGCKASKECTATVKLDAVGDYHLNKEYPHKVKVADSDAVKFAKPEFGKTSGDFKSANDKSGVITVTFTPAKAGKTEVTGTFKFAVCSDRDCAPAQETIKVAIDVKK